MKDNYNTGIASEYYVLSLLYRQGYEAYLTSGNKKSIDIRVVHEDRTISIDVKAVQGYSSLIVNNVTSKPNHYVVFLIYNNKFSDVTVLPDVYIVPSADVLAITKSFKDQKRVFKTALQPYKDRWGLLFACSSSLEHLSS
jgi:hypothetical protein